MRRQAVGCHVRDPRLAVAGEGLIDRAGRGMPALLQVRRRFERERPLEGLRLSACLRVTADMATLVVALRAGGADVVLCASDPASTDDAVAAALAHSHGVRTYAIEGEDEDAHRSHVATVLAHRPELTVDEGARLTTELHRSGGRLLDRVLGGTEHTTAGAIRLKAMAARGELRYPIIAIDEAGTDLRLASQALALEYLGSGARLGRAVHDLPVEIRRELRGDPKAVGEGVR